MSEMWKLRKLLFPRKKQTLPSAKMNYKGKLVSEPEELKSLLAYEYGQVRLRKRPVHPLHKKIVPIRKKLLSLKLKSAIKKKTPPFQMNDLDFVLKGLKTNKARDPEGIERTIFKRTIIGSNLRISLLQLFNKIKTSGEIP